ncbi:FtsX-like permease family protein [Isoptericola aurantiacus]|uniref:FtsX-like permease family protein n=1 Tax=Isoptericola aurantiacus TaxID=3377839 RepID=UPI00383ACF35
MSMLLLVRRHLRTSVGATLVLATITLGAAAVSSAVPRAVATVHADQLAYATGQTSAISRDVVATGTVFPGYGSDDGTPPGSGGAASDAAVDPPQPDLDGYLDALGALAAAQPPPLSDVLGAPDLLVSGSRVDVDRVAGNDVARPRVVLRAGPTARDQIDLVAGRWPRPTPVPADLSTLLPGADGVVDVEPVPAEVAMSSEAADELGWSVGAVHATRDPLLPPLELVGVWEPRDAAADYWAHGPLAVSPEILVDPNVGKIVTAAVFADPGTLGAWEDAPSVRTWFPVDATGVSAQDAPTLLAQLRGLTATTSVVVEGDPAVLEPASGMIDVLTDALGRRQGVDAIVAVLAVGPLGALAVVLTSAARLVVDRRRAALALVRARGASSWWTRGVVGLEGLVVGLPAALAGLGLGLLVVPGPVGAGGAVLAAVCGLAPAAALAAVASPRGVRARRADLDGAPVRRRRARLLLEGAVVLAAVGTAWSAVDRGVLTDRTVDPGAGPDPLVVLAPLLVGLAVALLTLRLVPPAVRGAERVLAARRDLVPFLGAARVRRDPAVGALPAVALVLAVGVAASSTVLAATVRTAIAQEAWTAVGADVRVAGPVVDAGTVDALSAVDGVDAVAAVADSGRYLLGTAAGGVPVTVYTTDGDALARLQDGAPGAPSGLDALTAPGAVLPAVATGDVGEGTVLAGAGGATVEVRVVDHVDALPGLPPSSAALLVDAGRAAEIAGMDPGTSRLALLGLDDGATDADRTRVEVEIGALAPTAVVDDPVASRRELLASPATSGLATAFAVAVVLSGLLCVAVVVLALVLAAPARARLLAVLRTLGLPRGAERGIVAWETGPWVAAALVAGAVLGWLVPALVLAAVDLTPLTGGHAAPQLVADPWWLAALATGLVGLVAACAGVVGGLGRRRGPVARGRGVRGWGTRDVSLRDLGTD